MLNRRLHNSLKCIAMHGIYINDMNICKHMSIQNATSWSVYTFKIFGLSLSELTSILFQGWKSTTFCYEFDITSEIML